MKHISTIKISFFITILFVITACEDQIEGPVADFRIMDAAVINELNVNNIKVGESIVFENTGQGMFLTVYTGEEGEVYDSNPSPLEMETRVKKYTLPNGEQMEFDSNVLGKPYNLGRVVNTKSGQLSYAYKSAGASGDTTYVVTWIATNADVHGNSKSTIKQVTIHVKDNN